MRNRKYDNYALNSFPANYSGQYSPEEVLPDDSKQEKEPPAAAGEGIARSRHGEPSRPHDDPGVPHKEEHKEEKKSILGSILGGGKDGEKKGGLLSGLFNKDKDGGILSGIELEDLILLAVIFFLLKDGFEDDLIIILALILLSG